MYTTSYHSMIRIWALLWFAVATGFYHKEKLKIDSLWKRRNNMLQRHLLKLFFDLRVIQKARHAFKRGGYEDCERVWQVFMGGKILFFGDRLHLFEFVLLWWKNENSQNCRVQYAWSDSVTLQLSPDMAPELSMLAQVNLKMRPLINVKIYASEMKLSCSHTNWSQLFLVTSRAKKVGRAKIHQNFYGVFLNAPLGCHRY